jgi:hypothetical protein
MSARNPGAIYQGVWHETDDDVRKCNHDDRAVAPPASPASIPAPTLAYDLAAPGPIAEAMQLLDARAEEQRAQRLTVSKLARVKRVEHKQQKLLISTQRARDSVSGLHEMAAGP